MSKWFSIIGLWLFLVFFPTNVFDNNWWQWCWFLSEYGQLWRCCNEWKSYCKQRKIESSTRFWYILQKTKYSNQRYILKWIFFFSHHYIIFVKCLPFLFIFSLFILFIDEHTNVENRSDTKSANLKFDFGDLLSELRFVYALDLLFRYIINY